VTIQSSHIIIFSSFFVYGQVTGAIAKIWAARPDCTKDQVGDAIMKTAKDLGEEGTDDEYGVGMVQTLEAYKYLLSLPPPCGMSQDDRKSSSSVGNGLAYGFTVNGIRGGGRGRRLQQDAERQ